MRAYRSAVELGSKRIAWAAATERPRRSRHEGTNVKPYLAPWSPQLLSILRLVTGFLVIAHGTQKWFSFPAPAQQPVELMSLLGVAATIEVIGGALMIVGLFTRPTAFILSGLCAFAYFIAHAPDGFWPLVNGGELAALYSFVFLYFAAAGAGPWSIDHLLRKRRDD
jgi:putative oxidoreductase